MKRIKLLSLAALTGALALTSCSDDDAVATTAINGPEAVAEANTEAPADYNFGVERPITFENGVIISNHDAIVVENNKVTIKQDGTYRISGSMNNTQIVVNAGANDYVRIVMDNATLSNQSGPVIDVVNAYKVILRAEQGKTTTLTDGSGNGRTPVIRTNTKLTVFGTGNLVINDKDSDAIYSEGGVIIKDVNLTLNANADGIKSDYNVDIKGGTLAINAEGSSIVSDTYTNVSGGTVTIDAKQNGIKTGAYSQSQGTVTITGAGNGVVASMQNSVSASPISIDGGNLYVNVSQNGLESAGNVVVNSGMVSVIGNTASGKMAVKSGGSFAINGGKVVALGDTAAVVSTSAQNTLAITYDTEVNANTIMNIQTPSQSNIMGMKPGYAYRKILVSSPDINDGGVYRIFTGGIATGELVNGVYNPLTGYTGGQLSATFTAENRVTEVAATR